MISLASRPRKSLDILTQEVSGTLVLLNRISGEYYTLNEVGGRVWSLCDGRSVAKILSEIQAEFDAPESIESDVLEILNELASEKLVLESA